MRIESIKVRMGEEFDHYELYYMKERIKKFESKDREISIMEIKEEEGLALRAIKDHRLSFSCTYDLANASDKLLKNTGSLLPLMEVDLDRFFPQSGGSYPTLSIYDSAGLKTDDQAKMDLLIDMERTIRDYDERIVTVRNCELQEIEYEVNIENSHGVSAGARKTIYLLSALCVAKDDDEVSWYDWTWANALKDLDGKELGNRIAGKAISFLSGSQIDTGVYEGILTPQAACDMLDILGDSFLAENLFKNTTKLKGQEGKRIFSDILTIIDSGRKGMDAFPFDGEGVPSQENIVVENGCFLSYLYDSYYGSKLGRRSTGNSVRNGIKDLPKCAARGIFIEPGKNDVGEGISNGIVLEELMGTHTANEITGDFSLGAIGHLYRNGIKSPFQGVILSGNVYDIFNNVKEVGNDLKLYGSAGSPSLFVEGLKISGR